MTAPATTLAAQILAALDEEERVARETDGGTWQVEADPRMPGVLSDTYHDGVPMYVCEEEGNGPTPAQATHIARQDPAATLRRVEGLREVVTRLVGMAEFDRLMDRESIGARETLVALAGALGVEG